MGDFLPDNFLCWLTHSTEQEIVEHPGHLYFPLSEQTSQFSNPIPILSEKILIHSSCLLCILLGLVLLDFPLGGNFRMKD